MACKACGKVIEDRYFVANGHVVCEHCRRSLEEELNRGGAAGRLGKAIGLGVLATIGCAILWYAVLAATDRQWGILAVVVGLAIGGAVRKGSNGRGGWRYQALAIFLTYTAIVSSYVPFMIKGAREASQASQAAATASAPSPTLDSTGATPQQKTPSTRGKPSGLALIGALVAAIALLYALPVLVGVKDLISLLIIGFALYEAWKLNRARELRVSGPHQVSMQGAKA